MQTVGQQLIITAIPALPALVFVVLDALRASAQGERPVRGDTRDHGLAGVLRLRPALRRGRHPRRRGAHRVLDDLDRPRRGRLVLDGGLHRRPRGGDARRGVLREPHDPALLGRLYGGRQPLRLVLRGTQPVHGLDARAGALAELYRAVRVLGARRPVLVPPDRALVREAFGPRRGPEGVHRYQDRRRGAVRRDHHLLADDGDDELRWHLRGGPGRLYRRLALHGGRCARLYRRHRQERAVPAARVVAGRHGGPDPC